MMTLKLTLGVAMLTLCSLTTSSAQAQLWPFGGIGNGYQGRGCASGHCATQPAYSNNRSMAPGYVQSGNYAPYSYGQAPCLTGNCPNPQLGSNYAPAGYSGQAYRPTANCVGGNCNTNLNCANGQCYRPQVPSYSGASLNRGNAYDGGFNNVGYHSLGASGYRSTGYRSMPQPRNDYDYTPAYPNASGRSPFYR